MRGTSLLRLGATILCTATALPTGAASAYYPPPGAAFPGHTWDYGKPGSASLVSPPAAMPGDNEPIRWANGSSSQPTFSQDNRNVRLLAYSSTASNLVAGDTDGVSDVFVLERALGAGRLDGTLAVASVTPDGRIAANGPSDAPSIDGSTFATAHCIAFESRATNLAPGDRTSDWDVYVRDLATSTTMLVSGHAPADARDPVIDGRCRLVAFDAGGAVWTARIGGSHVWKIARGGEVDLQTNGRGVAYKRGRQVYYRALSKSGSPTHRLGEQLVSATAAGRPGNGDSAHPRLDDTGAYVAFDSTATDLCTRHRCAGLTSDENGRVRDVFRRTMSPHAPTHDEMEMVSVTLPEHVQANGPSYDPQISAAGENVVFTSRATNLTPVFFRYVRPTAVPRPYTWQMPRRRGWGHVTLIHRFGCVQGCPGPGDEPALSSRGNYVAWSAPMTEFCLGGWPPSQGGRLRPTTTDVFLRYVGPSHEGLPSG